MINTLSTAPKKIAVAVSGGGRSLQNLQEYLKIHTDTHFIIGAVISSHSGCGGELLAKKAGIPVFTNTFKKSEEALVKEELSRFLAENGPISLIVLAGFIRMFPALDGFQKKVINIHPALLPNYGGQGMYGLKVHNAVFANHEPESGATVHFVNDAYDEGKTIASIIVDIRDCDSPEKIAAKVFAAECDLYPKIITQIISGKISYNSPELPLTYFFGKNRLHD